MQQILKKVQICFAAQYTTQLGPNVYVKSTIFLTSLEGSTF